MIICDQVNTVTMVTDVNQMIYLFTLYRLLSVPSATAPYVAESNHNHIRFMLHMLMYL